MLWQYSIVIVASSHAAFGYDVLHHGPNKNCMGRSRFPLCFPWHRMCRVCWRICVRNQLPLPDVFWEYQRTNREACNNIQRRSRLSDPIEQFLTFSGRWRMRRGGKERKNAMSVAVKVVVHPQRLRNRSSSLGRRRLRSGAADFYPCVFCLGSRQRYE